MGLLHRRVARFRELVRTQEQVIGRDHEASVSSSVACRNLPMRRYLSMTVSLISSDKITPTQHNLASNSIIQHHEPSEIGSTIPLKGIPRSHMKELGTTKLLGESQSMEESKKEMVSRIVNWKGHDPNTFGDLILKGTFEICHDANPNAARKPFSCYLFENVFVACTLVKQPKKESLEPRPTDYALKLRGRIFMRTVLKVDRHTSSTGSSLLLTCEGADTLRPLIMVRIFCETKAIEEEWSCALVKQVHLSKGLR